MLRLYLIHVRRNNYRLFSGANDSIVKSPSQDNLWYCILDINISVNDALHIAGAYSQCLLSDAICSFYHSHSAGRNDYIDIFNQIFCILSGLLAYDLNQILRGVYFVEFLVNQFNRQGA